jgi:hypothetical protein
VPAQAPPRPQSFEAPWAISTALENIKRVADFWCSGDCDRAKVLPEGLFLNVLGHVLTKEEGKAIAAEEDARAAKRQTQFNNLNK